MNHSDISNIADTSEIFKKSHLIFKYLKEIFKLFRGHSKDNRFFKVFERLSKFLKFQGVPRSSINHNTTGQRPTQKL